MSIGLGLILAAVFVAAWVAVAAAQRARRRIAASEVHYRGLFEDLTGLREAHGEPARDRVAAIRDRAADHHAVADNGTRTPTAQTAEPVTADPAAEDAVAEDRDAAARNDELAAENADRSAYPPR